MGTHSVAKPALGVPCLEVLRELRSTKPERSCPKFGAAGSIPAVSKQGSRLEPDTCQGFGPKGLSAPEVQAPPATRSCLPLARAAHRGKLDFMKGDVRYRFVIDLKSLR
jgi:hypothetical protein